MSFVRRSRFRARRAFQAVTVFDNRRSLLGQLLGRADELEFRTDGLTIVCPNVPGARVPVFEVFAEDEYDLPWFTQGLREDLVVVDIGAHIGCFSLSFSTQHPQSRVHSYEPTPSTGEYLVRNVEGNDLGHRITVNRSAVGARSGTLVMADTGQASGHNGVMHLGEEGAVGIEVPCVSLESAFEAAGGRVDLVKMDAEGAEYDIILTSPPELWQSVRRVVMEYHPLSGHSFDEIEAFLKTAGLSVVKRIDMPSGLGLAWLSRDELEGTGVQKGGAT